MSFVLHILFTIIIDMTSFTTIFPDILLKLRLNSLKSGHYYA